VLLVLLSLPALIIFTISRGSGSGDAALLASALIMKLEERGKECWRERVSVGQGGGRGGQREGGREGEKERESLRERERDTGKEGDNDERRRRRRRVSDGVRCSAGEETREENNEDLQ
jgi:hypothetical protein